MTDSQFKTIDSDNIHEDDCVHDDTLDCHNATKECESSDNSDNKYVDNIIICIDDIPHYSTTIDNIDSKMFNIAQSIKHSISSYDNEINIYKKDDDIVITTRYKFFILSYESIHTTISYMFINNYENVY